LQVNEKTLFVIIIDRLNSVNIFLTCPADYRSKRLGRREFHEQAKMKLSGSTAQDILPNVISTAPDFFTASGRHAPADHLPRLLFRGLSRRSVIPAMRAEGKKALREGFYPHNYLKKYSFNSVVKNIPVPLDNRMKQCLN
jgi:hypothetical protein